jgi:2-phosphosulfolactate phosphatase
MIVVIDCFPSTDDRYFRDYAIVAVDVIRATTTSVTAVSAGRRCFPVDSAEAAFQMRQKIPNCLLAGEVAGLKPDGFDLNNSPASLALRSDHHRPVVLLSSSGTKLMVQSSACEAAYVACLRNYKAVASHIAGRHECIALLGASTRGEFREEDQLCCAWIAYELLKLEYEPGNRQTLNLIEQWKRATVDACASGNSAAYLRRSGQLDDLNFVLSHINDVPRAFRLTEGEILPVLSFPETGTEGKPAANQSRSAA